MSYIPFEDYEAVLLLYMTQMVEKYEFPLRYVAIILSKILRDIAMLRGFHFDESFRSVSGLSYQMRMMSVELAKKGYTSNTKSIIGRTAYEYYHHTDKENEMLLLEALSMSADNKNKRAFLKYVTINEPSTAADIYIVMEQVENAAQKIGIISGSLYDRLDISKIDIIESKVVMDRSIDSLKKRMRSSFQSGFALLREFVTSDMYNNDSNLSVNIDDIKNGTPTINKANNTVSTTSSNIIKEEYTINPDIHSVNEGCIPVSFTYYLKKISVTSWEELYVKFMRILWGEKRILCRYIGKSVLNDNVVDFVRTAGKSSQKRPVMIANDVYLETKLDTESLLIRLEKIMNIVSVPVKRLSITYSVFESKENNENKHDLQSETGSHTAGEEITYTRFMNNPEQEGNYNNLDPMNGDEDSSSVITHTQKESHHERVYDLPDNNEWIIEELNSRGLEYQDKRVLGGCLWIVGGHELDGFVNDCYEKGYSLIYKPDGCRTYPNKAVWWTKDVKKDVSISKKSNRSNDSKLVSRIIEIMNNHYQYGFKIDSIRELMRFRQFAEDMDITLPENDDILIATIKGVGSLIDGKVFCKNDELPNELKNIVDSIISQGITVIYYSKLFELQNEWMNSHVITSPEMLKEYLQRHITGCYFAKTFFCPGSKETERNSVTSEIIRVWGGDQIRTVESLSNDLLYIPIENIWRVISGNDYFVLVEEGTYLYTEKLIIKEHEASDIKEYADNAINNSGFASLNDIPLGDIEEENYEIPRIALLNALFKRILSDNYRLNGCIITKDETELDAVLLLKKSLEDKEECTFDELNEELMQLTGRSNRQYTFQALYDEMIRVDKNLFVSNRKISFNVTEIDEVISAFITDSFVSLKEITTFAMFPICGSTWNHYVLESFCYKYSHKYSLHTIHFNDKNVGIIAEKDFNKKYDDMLAIELARSDIDFESPSIGQYLFDTGYLAKSKYAALESIIEHAKLIRGER